LTKPITPDHESVLLSEETAAGKCGISRPTFRRWVAANCIEPVLVPGAERRKLYRREDIEAFVRAR
jgi:predicted DNA-binding transcriptional regulator AlpA